MWAGELSPAVPLTAVALTWDARCSSHRQTRRRTPPSGQAGDLERSDVIAVSRGRGPVEDPDVPALQDASLDRAHVLAGAFVAARQFGAASLR